MALRTPPLREVHADRGAKFTEFGGWDMPVEFDSIRTEHVAVREAAGKFDVSHMGQITVSGPDASTLMGRLTTNDVTALDTGDSQYAMICDEAGTILDDTVIYRLPDGSDGDPQTAGATDGDDGDPAYLFVPNAGHEAVMHERWTDHREEWGLEAAVVDRTEEYGMVAVQGPEAVALLDGVADERVSDVSRFRARYAEVAGVTCWAARTGYTGEDGFELLFPADEAETVWSGVDCQPCGLGARDTLRLEAGLLLSGQDFDPVENPRNPYEAGVGSTVKLDTEFVGRDALERIDAEGVEETLVGVRLVDRAIPRHGYDVTDTDDRLIGTVTSGTMSPTLDCGIGLAYLPVEHADPGTMVRVVVRGQSKKARVESLPFVSRHG